jgi:TRAP-type C4-dicarboxylate transport system permease small subunit
VDFFTTNLRPAVNDKMDRFGAFLLALIFGLLAWRTALGGLNSHASHSETQIMGFPEWVVYAVMTPAFVLAGFIALHQTIFGFATETDEREVKV